MSARKPESRALLVSALREVRALREKLETEQRKRASKVESMSERRDTRVIAGVGVILTIDGNVAPCMTRNMSRGGMFVVTTRRAEPDTIVRLEVVHGGKRLRAGARVVECAKDGLGLGFIEASEAFRLAIRALVDEIVTVDSDDDMPEGAGPIGIGWSLLPNGRWWKPWRNRRHDGAFVNLNLEGAAMHCKTRPPVGQIVLVHLDSLRDRGKQALRSEAEVARHTDAGFAVRFLNPDIEFRRAISYARKLEFTRRQEVTAIDVHGPETVKSHVRAPLIVPSGE